MSRDCRCRTSNCINVPLASGLHGDYSTGQDGVTAAAAAAAADSDGDSQRCPFMPVQLDNFIV